jgi:hypothetical protein
MPRKVAPKTCNNEDRRVEVWWKKARQCNCTVETSRGGRGLMELVYIEILEGADPSSGESGK